MSNGFGNYALFGARAYNFYDHMRPRGPLFAVTVISCFFWLVLMLQRSIYLQVDDGCGDDN